MYIDLNTLQANIEYLRRQMVQIAAVKGSLVDQEVVNTSQKLDVLITEYQRLKLYLGI